MSDYFQTCGLFYYIWYNDNAKSKAWPQLSVNIFSFKSFSIAVKSFFEPRLKVPKVGNFQISTESPKFVFFKSQLKVFFSISFKCFWISVQRFSEPRLKVPKVGSFSISVEISEFDFFFNLNWKFKILKFLNLKMKAWNGKWGPGERRAGDGCDGSSRDGFQEHYRVQSWVHSAAYSTTYVLRACLVFF